MAPRLPPELMASIPFAAFHHTRHLRTLHSLLLTSKLFFRETARVLYFDPFYACSLAFDGDTARLKLIGLMFSLAPTGDDSTTLFPPTLDLVRIRHPAIDYIDLIHSNKIDLTDFFDDMRFMVEPKIGYMSVRVEHLIYVANLQSTLAWTIYGRHLSRFSRLHVPSFVIPLLARYVDQLSSLQYLDLPFVCYRPGHILDDLFDFVEKMQAAHGPDQLRDIVCVENWSQSRFVERNLDSLLPPRSQQPTFYDDNQWRSYESDDISTLDLSCVKKAWSSFNSNSSTSLFRQGTIQRCRSLWSLTSYDKADPTCFDWAVEERRKHDEALQQVAQGTATSTLNLPQLVPLRYADLEDIGPKLVESVMYAFSATLEHIKLRLEKESVGSRYGATWNLPKLHTLIMTGYNNGFAFHPEAFDRLPRLRKLELTDQSSFRSTKALVAALEDHCEATPWRRLLNLRELCIRGLNTVSFDPSSLRWMPELEVLTIQCLKVKKDFCYSSASSFTATPIQQTVDMRRREPRRSIDTPFSNSHLWTWDWDMPSLRRIQLYGDVANRFRFQWLKHCPCLEVLLLDIGGTSRLLEFSDEDLSEIPTLTRLRELYLMGDHHTSGWLLSNTSLARLLHMCGPQLSTFHLYTKDASILTQLEEIARTRPALKRIDITPRFARIASGQLGLRRVGKRPCASWLPDEQGANWYLLSLLPHKYRSFQLWFFGGGVFARIDDIHAHRHSNHES